jgi:4-hydroxy-tetrahydrodipicolinate synthase
MKGLKGLGTALVTPFKNGEIDYEALEKLIEHQISGGVDYLVTMGTTGESVTLTKTETERIVRFTVEQAAGRVPVVVGIGGNNTTQLRQTISQFNFDGITAILSSSPAYNKPSQEGIYQHYMALASVSPLPMILYNVPGRTSSNISTDTTLRLAHDSQTIVGIKEASADLVQGAAILRDKPEDFLVISGDDPTALPLISLGGEGCISVMSNAWPAEFQKVIGGALKGNWEEARRMHLNLLPLHHWLYIDGNPCGIKSALHYKGMMNKDVRLPLVNMQEAHYASLVKTIQEVEDNF